MSTFPFLILIGLVGGAVWNFFGGIRNAPATNPISIKNGYVDITNLAHVTSSFS